MRILIVYGVSALLLYSITLLVAELSRYRKPRDDDGWDTGETVNKAVTDDRGRLYVCHQNSSVSVFDRLTRQRLTPEGGLPIGTSGFDIETIAAFATETRRVLAAAVMRSLVVFDLSNPRTPTQTPLRQTASLTAIKSLAFSPDGKTLAFGDEDGYIAAWNWDEPDEESIQLRSRDALGGVRSIAYRPDGRMLGVVGKDSIGFWNPQSGVPRGSISHTAACNVGFSPDGKSVAIAGNHIVAVYDPESKDHKFTIDHFGVGGIVYSPEGEVLATLGADGLRFWHSDTGAPLSRAPIECGARYAMFVGPRKLVTVRENGIVREIRLPDPLSANCSEGSIDDSITPLLDPEPAIAAAGFRASDGVSESLQFGPLSSMQPGTDPARMRGRRTHRRRNLGGSLFSRRQITTAMVASLLIALIPAGIEAWPDIMEYANSSVDAFSKEAAPKKPKPARKPPPPLRVSLSDQMKTLKPTMFPPPQPPEKPFSQPKDYVQRARQHAAAAEQHEKLDEKPEAEKSWQKSGHNAEQYQLSLLGQFEASVNDYASKAKEEMELAKSEHLDLAPPGGPNKNNGSTPVTDSVRSFIAKVRNKKTRAKGYTSLQEQLSDSVEDRILLARALIHTANLTNELNKQAAEGKTPDAKLAMSRVKEILQEIIVEAPGVKVRSPSGSLVQARQLVKSQFPDIYKRLRQPAQVAGTAGRKLSPSKRRLQRRARHRS